jgi:hypothetical protein
MMRRKSFVPSAVIIILLSSVAARAQSQNLKEYRFELGAQFSVLHFKDFAEQRYSDKGVGARFTYNMTRNIALEAEVNLFSTSTSENIFRELQQIRQGLFGIKAGKRGERVGVFGKARPGFIHYGKVSPVLCVTTVGVFDCSFPTNNFAFDAGGVLELYPTRRTIVRFDGGDTIIRRSIIGGTKVTHNFQLSAGFGVRF